MKVKVEIYEADPFSGCCCGPVMSSPQASEKLMKLLAERNEIVRRLEEEFGEEIEIEREIVSSRRPPNSYPQHVRKLIASNTSLPFVLINEQLRVEGNFPSFEEFKRLIDAREKNPN